MPKRYEDYFYFFKWNYIIFLHNMIPLIVLRRNVKKPMYILYFILTHINMKD